MLNFKWTKKHTVIAVSAAVYAVLILFFIIIINNKTIYNWFNNFLSVLAPLIIGVAVAYLCNPVLVLFENKVFKRISRLKLRRALSLFCTYLLILLGLTVILLIVIPQLRSSYNSFTGNLKSYTDKAITFVNKTIYQFDNFSGKGDFGNYIDVSDVQKRVSELFTSSSNFFSTLATYVVNYATTIAVGIKNLLFGIFISIYILIAKERLIAKVKKMFASFLNNEHYMSLANWISFTNQTFGSYIKAQLLDALLVAIECAVIFSIAGIPYPMLLAFIIGMTNIIPVFGPFIGGIPSGFIVFITKPEKVLLFIILIVLIQQIDGNFVLPKLVGTHTGMTSLGVLCAITVMGGYFGIVGMILGVPFFVVAGEIIRRLVNSGLEKRGMSTELADYYSGGAQILTEEAEDDKKEGLFVRIVHALQKFIKNILSKISHLFSKKK